MFLKSYAETCTIHTLLEIIQKLTNSRRVKAAKVTRRSIRFKKKKRH